MEEYCEDNLCVEYKDVNGTEISPLWWNITRMDFSLLKYK